MKPLWMVFNNLDPLGDKIAQIFKQGDGVWSMQCTLHIINATLLLTALYRRTYIPLVCAVHVYIRMQTFVRTC